MENAELQPEGSQSGPNNMIQVYYDTEHFNCVYVYR